MRVLSKADQKKLKLQMHITRTTSNVRDSIGLQARRRRVELLKQAAELKKTRSKARELGLPTEEVLRLRKVFSEVDDDNSGEINFQEMSILTKYYLMIFMIIGRVELLTLLIICKKFFFKN